MKNKIVKILPVFTFIISCFLMILFFIDILYYNYISISKIVISTLLYIISWVIYKTNITKKQKEKKQKQINKIINKFKIDDKVQTDYFIEGNKLVRTIIDVGISNEYPSQVYITTIMNDDFSKKVTLDSGYYTKIKKI